MVMFNALKWYVYHDNRRNGDRSFAVSVLRRERLLLLNKLVSFCYITANGEFVTVDRMSASPSVGLSVCRCPSEVLSDC